MRELWEQVWAAETVSGSTSYAGSRAGSQRGTPFGSQRGTPLGSQHGTPQRGRSPRSSIDLGTPGSMRSTPRGPTEMDRDALTEALTRVNRAIAAAEQHS